MEMECLVGHTGSLLHAWSTPSYGFSVTGVDVPEKSSCVMLAQLTLAMLSVCLFAVSLCLSQRLLTCI